MIQLQEKQIIYWATEVIAPSKLFWIRNMFGERFDVEVELFILPWCGCLVC